MLKASTGLRKYANERLMPQLGIPTANISIENIPWIEDAVSGVYFGWCSVQLPPDHPALTSSPQPASTQPLDESTLSPTKLSPITFPTPSSLLPPALQQDKGWRTYPFVMSIGYNPFYKNRVRSAEVHVLHEFGKDFYGSEMRVSVMGFVRPEYDYDSLEGLVKDIREDCWVAGRSLGRVGWELGGEQFARERDFLWDVDMKEAYTG